MTSGVEAERDKYSMINFEETELRLGMPGASANDSDSGFKNNCCTNASAHSKRSFSETSTTTAVDLKLNLSSSNNDLPSHSALTQQKPKDNATAPRANDPAKPPAKAQVVGWPPVRSFRKNIVSAQKNNGDETEKGSGSSSNNNNSVAFIKVSMDGAPYLRKVDLKLHKSYQELSDALAKMFSSFTINGQYGSQGMKEFLNERKLIDLLNGSDYVPTYQDKDGDWMLVGDVPWEMFVESCKRLRIMKGSEAIGLAPRAVEKCKSRS